MPVTVKCAWCGKEIQTYPSRIKRYEKRKSNFYCNIECKKAYWAKYRTGENNPKTKPRIIVQCAQCGKDIYIEKWRLGKAKNHFCSKNCKNNWFASNFTGEKSPCYKKESHIITKCAYCNKNFVMWKGQFERFKLHFCSKECANQYKTGKSGHKFAKKKQCVCPVCGKLFEQYINRKIKRKTCSKECAHKLAGMIRSKRVKLICAYCGKKYTVHKCEEHRSKYCSRSCLALAKIASTIHSNTIPELIVKRYLDKYKIEYIHQYPIDKMTVDFYLPQFGTIIEVQGDYWHGNPDIYPKGKLDKIQISNQRRDKHRKYMLEKLEYKVVYLWENDLKKDPEKAIRDVLHLENL